MNTTTQKRPLHQVEQQTDNANATAFVESQGLNLKYVTTWSKWLVYQHGQWVIDSGDAIVTEKAKSYAKSLWHQLVEILADDSLNDDQKNAARAFVKQTNNAPRIRRMLELAAASPSVRIDHTALNDDPHLLNVLNGTVDLRTGRLRNHQREDLITQMASVAYHHDATCPQWEEALSLIFGGDDELVRFVQCALGYSLIGGIDEHILLILHGNGCNGKSTLTNTVSELLGDYSATASEKLLLKVKHQQHPTEKADLYQRRFVSISEPSQGRTLNEGLVKELTGDRTVKARRMREDFWEFEATHTFWMNTNHRPRIRGTDEGIWRRIKLVPFEVDLRKVTTPRPGFVETLIREEGPGILNWLIEGCREYQTNGLTEPEAVKTATADYRDDEDEFGRFIKETFEDETNGVVVASEAFEAYQEWGGSMSQTTFGREMKRRFDWDKPRTTPFRGKTIYVGISLTK